MSSVLVVMVDFADVVVVSIFTKLPRMSSAIHVFNSLFAPSIAVRDLYQFVLNSVPLTFNVSVPSS